MATASKITIEISGNEVPDFLHLSISQTIYGPHTFSLVCRRDLFEQPEAPPLSGAIDKIGSDITFLIDGINTGTGIRDFFFRGIITGISASENGMNQHEVTFRGYSPEILLHGSPVCRSFENKTLRQIAEQVMQPYPSNQISLTGEPGVNIVFPYIVQYKETDFEFLSRLARRFGQWFFFDGMDLVLGDFKKTTIEGIAGINLSDYHIGADLAPLNFGFSKIFYTPFGPSTGTSTGPTKDISGDLDPIGKKVYAQSQSTFPITGNSYLPQLFIDDNGSYIPDQHFIRDEKKSIASRFVTVSGNSDEPLEPGNIFRIKRGNAGQEIDAGAFIITGVNHSFDNSMNYSNMFQGVPSSLALAPNTKVKAAALCETQSAIVKDNNDPQKLGRIKVHFSWQEDSQSTSWIRMVTPHTGQGAGIYFIPEIGHEVLVGFENSDPQLPYIIGSLFNSENKPDEFWVTKSNDLKVIRTRSGNTIEFNDAEGHEEVCIYNGRKNDPANMMRLRVSNNGYEIYSKGPINLTSGDDITLKGKNIMLDAKEYIDLHPAKRFQLYTDEAGVIDITNDDNSMVFRNNEIHIEGALLVKIKGTNVEIN